MRKYLVYPTLVAISIVFCLSLFGQGNLPYSFNELSGSFYEEQLNALKKAKPDAATLSDKKAQKKYTELSEERRRFIIKGFAEDNFVYQKDIVGYLGDIATTLKKNNPSFFKETPLILLDRSDVVNAYALGNNIVVINLGLFLFVESKEELALIIAHELAHNILRHSDNSLKETSIRLSSDEYKDSLNAVLDSKYERLSRLKKLVTGYTVSRSRHSRYHEASADSLAILLLKNSKIGFDARFFLRLDSVKSISQHLLGKPIKYFFEQYKLGFDEGWLKQGKGLSSRNYQFRDTAQIDEDSLKTHPDCQVRYETTKSKTDAALSLTVIPGQLKEAGRKIMLWNKIASQELTPALYYIFLEKEKGNTDAWYDLMSAAVFSILNYADKDLNRFNAVGSRQKEHVAMSYYDLQTVLTKMNRTYLETSCHTLHQHNDSRSMQRYEKELYQALQLLDKETKPDKKTIEQIKKQAFASSADNPYQELFNTLSKN